MKEGWFVNPVDRSVAVPAKWQARRQMRKYRDHLVTRPAMSPLRGLEMVVMTARSQTLQSGEVESVG